MKVTISKDALVAGLKKVLNVVSSKTTIPALNNVLIKTENDKVQLITSDLEVTICTEVTALVEEPGATTLPAKKFSQIISSLSAGDVVLTTDEDELTSISCNKSFFKIVGLSANAFPQEDGFAEDWVLTLPAIELKKTLAKVSYARSTDETRLVLNGIFVSVRDGVLTIAGTDGRRLALVEKPMESAGEADGDVILPPKVVIELEKTLDGDGQVNIRLSESRASFEWDGTTIVTKLVEGIYPNYRQVIPSGLTNSVAIPREVFSTVLNRVSMVVTESSSSVSLCLSDSVMEVSAMSNEFGEAKEPIEVSYEGKKLEISFNPVFFSEPLKHLECDQLVMQFNDEYNPVSISGDDGFLYVVMPMRGN